MGRKNEVKITTIIGRGAECNGDFSAQGSVRVDGTINGDVNVSETVILGATGVINGDVTSKVAIIGGEIVGSVNAPERTEITSTGKLFGDITTNTIIIDEKAVFQGSCNMNQEASGKRTKPSSKAVKAGQKSAKAAIVEALKEVEEASTEEGTLEPISPEGQNVSKQE